MRKKLNLAREEVRKLLVTLELFLECRILQLEEKFGVRATHLCTADVLVTAELLWREHPVRQFGKA